MREHETGRLESRRVGWLALAAVLLLSPVAAGERVPYTQQWHVRLQRLPPDQVLTKLDLDRPGLEAVREAADRHDQPRALAELLRYYRHRYPPPSAEPGASPQNHPAADRICRHVFQWGPYEPADYGPDIDWTKNPADDIEWVAAIYRFYWADSLANAYAATRDDKYARAFVELTTDWIAKHPLDDWTRTHPTLTRWKGFAWLDLQTGIRAAKAVNAFKTMLHSQAITPEFLAVFLASLYDHQHKTERVPMGIVHNKAIFEQCGVLAVCRAFPEFSETTRWATLAVERASDNLLAQTTPQGVQREWCGSYHLAVLNDSIDIMEGASALRLAVPDDFRRRARAMGDVVLAVATPDLAWPMFGDTGRPRPTPADRTDAQLYKPLIRFSQVFDDPKYAARARGDEAALPEPPSIALDTAGLYCLRSAWGPDGLYMALHNAPPALSGHDQPDNGTFELYAFGRWLMTDSGFYTYGHDAQARAWHRQTRVHQTLTLDGRDSKTDGRLRLWYTSKNLDTLVTENPSYPGLLHRRTVWFVDKKLYVILDEAIGQATGTLRVHWTPAPGPGRLSPDRSSFTTQFPDANVLIHAAMPRGTPLDTEDGWFAWNYNERRPRTALSVTHPGAAPAAFLTVLAPYRGTTPPQVEASWADPFAVGSDEAQVLVRAVGQHWRLGRHLASRTAWAASLPASAPSP